MKQQRNYPIVTVTDKGAAFLKAGHVWVYEQEAVGVIGAPANGAIVDVLTQKGRYLGTGFYNSQSKIRVRILSRNANDTFDKAFFARRLQYAFDYRKTVMGGDFGCCRLVFGEADGFPGLTVDRFGDVLVTQTMSLGIEQRKDVIFPLMVKLLAEMGAPVTAIYERNDIALREKEGMTESTGFYRCDGLRDDLDGKLILTENGIDYEVDYIHGQKTGFFLDQKYNRLAVSKLARGMKVLDCFTHTGSFAMNAAKGGAAHVTAVDVSQFAVDTAAENAKINGLSDRMDFVCADVFELLPKLEKEHADYNFIILDPPAFTKSRKTTDNAKRGYKEINYRAMKMLPRGGYLATCSCSHFMPNELFRKMLLEAARDAGVTLRLIEERRAAPDHPVAMAIPETDYLKFYLLQIV